MAVYVKIATVATSIAALTWPSGVTVKDFSGMPASGNLIPGIMYPYADDTFGNVDFTEETYGTMGSEKQDLFYDLVYRYLHCTPNGGPGGIYDVFGGIVSKIASIAVVFRSNDVVPGAVDLRLKTFSKPKIVEDPAGNQFWGCDFTLRIQEFCEIAP